MPGLSDYYLPASMRYNNPGAMNFGPFARARGASQAGRFAQFSTPEAGWQAMDDLLGVYRRRGQNTVSSVIGGTPDNPNRAWAPRGVDNNSTDQYISTVARRLGIGPNDAIPDAMWPQLAEAMAGYEAGRPNARPGASPPPMALGGPQASEAPMPGAGGKVGIGPMPMAAPFGLPVPTLGQEAGAGGMPRAEDLGQALSNYQPLPPMAPSGPQAAPAPQAPPFGAPTVTPEQPQVDADAIVRGAQSAADGRAAAQPRPFALADLASNPLFMAGLSILGTAPGGNWGPAGAQAMMAATQAGRQQIEFQRQQQQRATMDRVWGEAFPGGQPNLQHPLLAGQTPQVAAMIAGLGPEAAIPMLAKSAMERRQLEFKTAGDQAFIFDPRTGQSMPVPGAQPRPPEAIRTRGIQADTSYRNLSSALDDYQRLIERGGAVTHPGQHRDAVVQSRTNILLQLKELHNLGVLNGPDLTLMEQLLVDPTIGIGPSTIPNTFGGAAGRTAAGVTRLKEMLRTIRNNAVAPTGQAPVEASGQRRRYNPATGELE